MIDTSCRKCKAPAPAPPQIHGFKLTGYLCECGHWNDLKRRKDKEADK